MKDVADRRMGPRAVVFDLGRVLLDFDFGIMARNLAGRSRESESFIRKLLDQSPLLHRYETGLMTTRDFTAEVIRQIGFQGDSRDFEPLFGDIFSEIPEMIALQERLRHLGIPRYIFSNTSEMAVSFIRSRYPFFVGFEGYVFSYKINAMKPLPRSYEAVEQHAGCRPEELLFIDDRADNIEGARARGWRTIHQTDVGRSVAEVEKLLGIT